MQTQSISCIRTESGNENKALPIIFTRWIWNRLHEFQKNYSQIITGGTGEGKTLGAIARAYLLNPERFSADDVVLSAKEFLRRIKASKRGDAIIWDESGVGLDKRQWQSVGNILTSHALQTYRVKRLAVFFCTPDPSFIDSRAMRLMNCFSEYKRFTPAESVEFLYNIELDRKRGIFYYPWFSFHYNNVRYLLPTIHTKKTYINLVPKEIMEAIENKTNAFKEKVLDKAEKEANFIEEKRWESGPTKTIFDLVNEVLADKKKYSTTIGNLSPQLVSTYLGVSRRRADTICILAKKNVEPMPVHQAINIVSEEEQAKPARKGAKPHYRPNVE